MSDFYGPADEGESIATIHAALESGITLLDTGDFYGMGHNEMLLGRALTGMLRAACALSVKFGAQRAPDRSSIGYDARPAAVKTALAYSLQRLGTACVDVSRPARLDPGRNPEHAILPTARELGIRIGITAYGVLSRGLLSERAVDAARTLSAVPGREPRAQPHPGRGARRL